MSAGNEFSRTFVVDPMPHAGIPFVLTAAPQECTALARRFELQAIDRLEVSGWIRPEAAINGLAVEGRITAAVTQTCVATLAPVPAVIDADFRRLFAAAVEPPEAAEIVVDPLAEEVEPLSGKELDVGEIAAEELALALDPYPRAADAAQGDLAPATSDDGPFAALARRRVD